MRPLHAAWKYPGKMKNPPANFWRWAEKLKLIEPRRSAAPRQMTRMRNTDSSGIPRSFGSVCSSHVQSIRIL
jgi:hypothetical protein